MTDARLARARAYALLGSLLVEGLDARSLAIVRALPGWLMDPIPADVIELDAIAAEHHACLQRELYPYAGVFLTREAIAGGASELVVEFGERLGLRVRPDAQALAGDHLGLILALLGQASGLAELDEPLAALLDVGLLSWLPALVVAAEALTDVGSLWPRALRATLELAAEHRLALGGPRTAAPLPSCDDPLADPAAGLRQIVEYLLIPACSGVFASHADLARIGRSLALPRGFGSRTIELDNLLRGAVERGCLPELIAALDQTWRERGLAMQALAEPLDLDAAIAPWTAAIARTRAMLARLAQAGAQPPSSP